MDPREVIPPQVVITVFRPEACSDPMGAHAFGPFDGCEILDICATVDEADSLVSIWKIRNPTWSFSIEPFNQTRG